MVPIEVLIDPLANLRAVAAQCPAQGVALASQDDDTADKSHLMVDLGAAIAEFAVTQDAAEVAIARGIMTAMGAPNAMRGESYSGSLSARADHGAGAPFMLMAPLTTCEPVKDR